MKIAFYKGEGNWTDKLIRLWTGGNYSHVEIVIGELWYTSSWYDGGVVRRKIDYKPENWDFLEVPDELADNVIELYHNTKNQKYDLLGILFNEVFPFKMEDKNKWYCSEWVAKGLEITIKTNPNALNKIIKDRYGTTIE